MSNQSFQQLPQCDLDQLAATEKFIQELDSRWEHVKFIRNERNDLNAYLKLSKALELIQEARQMLEDENEAVILSKCA